MNQNANMTYNSDEIVKYDGSKGLGYRPSPYTGVVSPITNSELANQNKLLNTSGERNEYSYKIKMAALLLNVEQTSGEYQAELDFGIVLDY